MASQHLALVVGANRGVGLEFCRQLRAKGYAVVASCRTCSIELAQLDVEIVTGVDISQDEGCAPLLAALRGRPLQLLVCSAGMLTVDTLDTLSFDDIQRQFEVNALGPLRVVAALRGNLRAGPGKVLLLSSKMASLAGAPGKMYGYRMSKVALNMAGRCLAADLRPDGVAVGMVHPGVVATEMYRTYNSDERTASKVPRPPPLSPQESCEGILAVLEQLDLQCSGGFWSYDGSVIPW